MKIGEKVEIRNVSGAVRVPMKIDVYGHHVSTVQGIKGRVFSVLHWNAEYDQRQLETYVVKAAQKEVKLETVKAFQGQWQFVDRLQIAINTLGKDFQKADAAQVQRVIDLFKEDGNNANLLLAFQIFGKCMKAGPSKLDFAVLKQKVLNHEQVEVAELAKQILIESKNNEATLGITKEGLLSSLTVDIAFEVLLLIFLYPLMSYVSFTVAFFLAAIPADVLSGLLDATLKGACNSRDILNGAYEGFKEKLKSIQNNPDSFHWAVDAFLLSAYVTVTWLYMVPVLEALPLMSMFMEYGVKNYVWKFSTLSFYFVWKSEMHKGNFVSMKMVNAFFIGAIRGYLKNYFYAPIATADKAVEVLAKVQGTEVGIRILNQHLWLLKDVYEILITVFSAFFAKLIWLMQEKVSIR